MTLTGINEVLAPFARSLELQRYGSTNVGHEFLYAIAPKDAAALEQLIAKVRADHSDAAISVVEPPRLPGL